MLSYSREKWNTYLKYALQPQANTAMFCCRIMKAFSIPLSLEKQSSQMRTNLILMGSCWTFASAYQFRNSAMTGSISHLIWVMTLPLHSPDFCLQALLLFQFITFHLCTKLWPTKVNNIPAIKTGKDQNANCGLN